MRLPSRKEVLEFLASHIEIEHILMDIRDKYKTEDLAELTTTQLLNLGESYGFSD